MTWAQRLKRVFNIDIEVCGRCGGSVRVIACIEDQDIIDRILTHLRQKRKGNTDPAIAGATDQSATWDIASFRWEGRAIADSSSTTRGQQGSQ